jgi:hypothetical protein
MAHNALLVAGSAGAAPAPGGLSRQMAGPNFSHPEAMLMPACFTLPANALEIHDENGVPAS